MAYAKHCDRMECGKPLGNNDLPFLQIHGSISEQMEDAYRNIEYRYLTPHPNFKGAWCDATCLTEWVEEQKKQTPFTRRMPRDLIHRRLLD